MAKFWLLKAEPDSRVVKGRDVKFSVDDFERIKTTPWEGVRNYEARNLMKEMKVGDKALFYHSNCKAPGIAAFAQVSKEAYPDYTAWDPNHPYYDAKTNKDDPRWYMVELTFVERAKNFIPLALLRYIADMSSSEPPSGIEYVGENGVKAIKGMDLVVRGRLSVQRVSEGTWAAIQLLANRGGWEALDLKKSPRKRSAKADRVPKGKGKSANSKPSDADEHGDQYEEGGERGAPHELTADSEKHGAASSRSGSVRKRKRDAEQPAEDTELKTLRRSTRSRK